ncbi:MAG TPA: glycerol-3-phosphate dehydrogenase/oxidase [Gemmatimonadaceae bacterium]|nr:glycerol-3-phosphate dehydrogenase/oxidase [Gemmatimonadaceae bacterium]
MARTFTALESGIFDVLVIGGGITGAGVARDAAIRGMRVAIVDKGDWASGTSSKSSRLVHGGIRYLEHGEIALVRESVREREILLRIAPGLVRPLEFTWPIYRGARLPKWKLRVGLTVYDMLAGKARGRRHHSLDRNGVMALEPGLRDEKLVGGMSYFDAETDDAGLTRANVKSAVSHGAVAVSFAKVESITASAGKGDGALVRDMIDGGSARVAARVIVSATGPWQAKGTKGSHIVVPRVRVGNQAAVTMISPDDGRVMFTLPSGDDTVIGTTDLRTDETPDNVTASEPEIAYMLRAVNFYFPDAKLTPDNVTGTWAGIRPLAEAPPGTSPSSISREHRISRDKKGMLVVTGGKLTTYRSMAAEIVDHVESQLGRTHQACRTDSEPL